MPCGDQHPVTYVEDACDECGLRLPRKDFQSWTEQEAIARESDTYQRFSSGRTGYRQGKTTYRIKHLRLCPVCYNRRVAAERARRAAEAAAARRALLVVGLVVLALIITVAMCSTLLRSPETNAVGSANEAPSDNQAVLDNTANSVPEMNANATVNSAANDADASGQADLSNDASVAPPPPDSQEQSPGSALKVAINQALETGESTPWSEGSDTGVVSVGERRVWRGRFCRTYGFTTNGVRSPVVVACQTPDGAWHATDTYSNAIAPAAQ